jgi:hypothetical protein
LISSITRGGFLKNLRLSHQSLPPTQNLKLFSVVRLKPHLNQAADRFGAAGLVGLLVAPSVNLASQHRIMHPHELSLAPT